MWKDLASDDAAAAYAAMQQLAAAPAEAVSLCKERLESADPPTAKQIEQWLLQLDDDDFTIRVKASQNLEEAGACAELALCRALKAKPAPEVRRRIEELLKTLEEKPLNPRALQGLRAVEVLERIGSAEALAVLRRLAQREPDPRILTEAKASLRRLEESRSAP